MLSLFHELKSDCPPITLAYDNMCNLDKLKASKSLLPFDPPYDKMWLNVNKIIDVFHFKNHVSPVCKERYCPDDVKRKNPKWNTQAGEQTFTWLSRFKHIVCSMPKSHHLFYIHRMVIRRNKYTSKCNLQGKKPLLPKSVSSLYWLVDSNCSFIYMHFNNVSICVDLGTLIALLRLHLHAIYNYAHAR